MKMPENTQTLETGTEMVVEDFDIGDKATLFKILRKKLYTNEIRAVVQEVMSNARDAHREHGNPDRPIQVMMPNQWNNEFWIRDFGVGISPERMSNVFIKYGNSTKRGDNVQTGGFGLGAKSPFAYSDDFQIETYLPDDDGNMMRRRYACVIDPTEIGQLLQIDGPEPTEEERGTKIVLVVKDGDASKFSHWVEDRARYWVPRPDVIGVKDFNWTWTDVTTLFEGDKWRIIQGGNGRGLALVDKIPYPVDRASVVTPDEDDESPVSMAFSMGFVIDLDVGDVAITAPREGIEYDAASIAVIRQRLETMMDEVAVKVTESIEDAGDIWEANRIYKSLSALHKAAVKGKAQWKGIPVTGDFGMASCGFKTVIYERTYKRTSNFCGTTSSGSTYFAFPLDADEIKHVYVLDEENLQPGRALYMFRTMNRHECDKIRVIVIPTGKTPEDQKHIDEAYEKMEQEHGLRTMVEGLTKFSTIEKWNLRKHGPKLSSDNGGPRTYGGPVVRVKELNYTKWEESKVTMDDEEKVFVQLFGGKPHMASNKRNESYSGQIRNLEANLGIKVVGVQTPFINKVPGCWVWLQDALEAKYQEVIATPDYAAAMTLDDTELHIDSSIGDINRWITKGKLTIYDNSLLDQWRKETERQEALAGIQSKILLWSGYAGHHDDDVVNPGNRLQVIKDAAFAAMPFLPKIERFTSGSDDDVIAEIQWYIDARDPKRDAADTLGKEFAAALDKKAYELYKGNGGTMVWSEIEKHLGLKSHNGNAARRAAIRHQKSMDLAAA
jgi:hypothetical protein